MNNVKKRKLEQPIEHKNPFANAKHINSKTRYLLEHPEAAKASYEKAHRETSMLSDEEIDAYFKPMGAAEWYRLITAPCTYRDINYDALRKEPFWSELEAMLIRRYGRVPE